MSALVIVDTTQYDQAMRLVGDEDTGVSLDCRLCDRGGLPIAYLLTYPDDPTYAKVDDVLRVQSITQLIDGGQQHLWARHPA